MIDYIATFVTGFANQIETQIQIDLPGVKILALFDGLIYFKYHKKINCFDKIFYFNNVFYVIRSFKGDNISFKQMVNSVCKKKNKLLIENGSFRTRFSLENQFVKVDNNLVKKVEKHILSESFLSIDRVNPTTEVWFIIRNDGVAFCGQLIFKRKTTEKNLNKGELRPEFAYLMCLCANLEENMVVYDPFCGFGAIPIQLVSRFKIKTVLASDVEKDKVSILKSKMKKNSNRIKCFDADALSMDKVVDNSVDSIITDPPWGYYEQIDDIRLFYEKMLRQFLRVTKPNSTIVVLSARKQEFRDSCLDVGAVITNQIDTLVNGKKAAVFIVHF